MVVPNVSVKASANADIAPTALLTGFPVVLFTQAFSYVLECHLGPPTYQS